MVSYSYRFGSLRMIIAFCQRSLLLVSHLFSLQTRALWSPLKTMEMDILNAKVLRNINICTFEQIFRSPEMRATNCFFFVSALGPFGKNGQPIGRGDICQDRYNWRWCRIFALGLNFSRKKLFEWFTQKYQVLLIYFVILLTCGVIFS